MECVQLVATLGVKGAQRDKGVVSRYTWSMPMITLPAHVDGRKIVLDEPYPLPLNSNLLVTLLPISEHSTLRATLSSDAFAFLNDSAEDIYKVTDGEPFHDAP